MYVKQSFTVAIFCLCIKVVILSFKFQSGWPLFHLTHLESTQYSSTLKNHLVLFRNTLGISDFQSVGLMEAGLAMWMILLGGTLAPMSHTRPCSSTWDKFGHYSREIISLSLWFSLAWCGKEKYSLCCSKKLARKNLLSKTLRDFLSTEVRSDLAEGLTATYKK